MIPEPTELSPQALASIQPRLQRAVALHQAGQLAEAEQQYRDILVQHPGHLPTLQMLGVLSFMAGRQDEGLALLQRVVEAAPMQAEAHNNLGNALRESGQAEAAVQRLAAAPGDAFLQSRIDIARFFVARLLPAAPALQ